MTYSSLFKQTFWFPSWHPSTGLPDLTGKTALVTGASTGLGKITAMELARKGCKVYCLGRSKEKTMAAIDDIKRETGNEKIEFLEADLQDLDSVQEASEAFLRDSKDLHILVNNAGTLCVSNLGIMNCPYSLTKQGIESQFGTNHFAHGNLIFNSSRIDQQFIANLEEISTISYRQSIFYSSL
jgi:retinol dehydrogenase 12